MFCSARVRRSCLLITARFVSEMYHLWSGPNYHSSVDELKSCIALQDRDDIPDHGPEGVGMEDDVVDEAVANEEDDEADGEDLLDDNMWKYVSNDPGPPRPCCIPSGNSRAQAPLKVHYECSGSKSFNSMYACDAHGC